MKKLADNAFEDSAQLTQDMAQILLKYICTGWFVTFVALVLVIIFN